MDPRLLMRFQVMIDAWTACSTDVVDDGVIASAEERTATSQGAVEDSCPAGRAGRQ